MIRWQHFLSSNNIQIPNHMQTRSKNPVLQSRKSVLKSTQDPLDSESNLSCKTDPISKKPPPSQVWTEQKLELSYIPTKLVGREEEAQQIYEFLKKCIMNRINRKVLYISGVPGCGKTASTMQIMEQFIRQVRGIRYLYINCLTIKKPSEIYRLIYSHLLLSCNDDNQRPKAVKSSDIERILPKIKKQQFIIIDEFDFLVTKDEDVLYNLFEWSSQTTNYLAYITISNTFDLPSKFGTKINSRMGDQRLFFRPYSQEKIRDVIADRLADSPYFSSSSILFASKKLAQYSSDIRIILGVLKEAFRQHLQEKKQGQIEVSDIARIWQARNVKRQKEAKQTNAEPTLHEIIIEYLENQTNRNQQCNTRKLYEYLHQKRKVTHTNIMVLLAQLEEMGQLKVKRNQGIQHFPCQQIKLLNQQDFFNEY